MSWIRRQRPSAADRQSVADRRLVRRLARSLRGWVLQPDQTGRQGELVGIVTTRIEGARSQVVGSLASAAAEARRLLARIASLDVEVRQRGRERVTAQQHLAEVRRATEVAVRAVSTEVADASGPSAHDGDAGPPIPWSRTFLLFGFIVLEYFLSIPVPQVLNFTGWEEKVVAGAFAMALVVLPKVLGGALREGATSEGERRILRWVGFAVAGVATIGAVTAASALRELVFANPDSGAEPAWWCLPVLAFSVSLASFASSALAPQDARQTAIEARQYLAAEARRLLRLVSAWFADQQRLAVVKQRAKAAEKERAEAEREVERAKAAEERSRDEMVAARESLGGARERIEAVVASADWMDRSARARQKALLQELVDMTLLESTRRPWPLSWLKPQRRTWRDGHIDERLLDELDGDFAKAVSDKAQPVLVAIDAVLGQEMPDYEQGAA